jgi:hypothetical protein
MSCFSVYFNFSIIDILNSSIASGQYQVIRFQSITTSLISGIAPAFFAKTSKLLSQLCHVIFFHLTTHHFNKFLGEAHILAIILLDFMKFLVNSFKSSFSQNTRLPAHQTKIKASNFVSSQSLIKILCSTSNPNLHIDFFSLEVVVISKLAFSKKTLGTIYSKSLNSFGAKTINIFLLFIIYF